MNIITSSYSMTASLRRAIALLQGDLSRGQKEISTGRHADLGATLGLHASQSFTIVGRQDTIDATLASNQLVAARLETTQVTLAGLLKDAEDMRTALITSQTHGGDRGALVTQATQSLTSLIGKLNGADADGFLFGGINTDREPITNYFATPAAANKAAVDSAFLTEFGFAQSDPAVASITSAQIQSFLGGAYSSLFSAASWKNNWSTASDDVKVSQVNLSVAIETSVTANDPAFAKVASAYVMLSDLGANKLDKNTYLSLMDTALTTLDSGIDLLTKAKARAGVMQNTVQNATDVMTIQKNAYDMQLHGLEAVDPLEASTRVNALMTRIETAYTLTARISQLSLTKYL